MVGRRGSEIRVIDLFAGMGGCSWGALSAGVEVIGAVDFWDMAMKTYPDNIKEAVFCLQKCENLTPEQVLDDVGEIDLLIASPKCTNHSYAKGAKKRSEASRMTAFQVTRFPEFYARVGSWLKM